MTQQTPMTLTHVIDQLTAYRNPCTPAKNWLFRQAKAGLTPEQAWKYCEAPSWMWWFIRRAKITNAFVYDVMECHIEHSPKHLQYYQAWAWSFYTRKAKVPSDEMDAMYILEDIIDERRIDMACDIGFIARDCGRYPGTRSEWREEFVETVLTGYLVNKRLCDVIRKHYPWDRARRATGISTLL